MNSEIRLVKRADRAAREKAAADKAAIKATVLVKKNASTNVVNWVAAYKAEKAARNPKRDWALLFKAA